MLPGCRARSTTASICAFRRRTAASLFFDFLVSRMLAERLIRQANLRLGIAPAFHLLLQAFERNAVRDTLCQGPEFRHFVEPLRLRLQIFCGLRRSLVCRMRFTSSIATCNPDWKGFFCRRATASRSTRRSSGSSRVFSSRKWIA